MQDTWLLFVRHGETNWNKEHRMQGQMEIPLNQLGEKQAEQIGIQLKDFPIDVLYSLPSREHIKRQKPFTSITRTLLCFFTMT